VTTGVVLLDTSAGEGNLHRIENFSISGVTHWPVQLTFPEKGAPVAAADRKRRDDLRLTHADP
jgi:hypothetical protein